MKSLSLLALIFLASCLPSPGKSRLNFNVKTTTPALNPETVDSKEFLEIKEKILIPYNCLDCHKGMAQEKIFLKKIVKGDPAKSRIYNSVEEGWMPKRVPGRSIKGEKLTPAELELIKNYIHNLNPNAITFETIKNKILIPYQCLVCHASMKDEQKLLTPKRVVRGNAEESKLFQLLKNGSMPAKSPAHPEVKGDPLTTKDLEIVREYIDALKPLGPPRA
jgi:hypothetical protein